MKVKLLSRVQLFATPWTVAYHAPLSLGFSRQEYWSGLPFQSKLPFKDRPEDRETEDREKTEKDFWRAELEFKMYRGTI